MEQDIVFYVLKAWGLIKFLTPYFVSLFASVGLIDTLVSERTPTSVLSGGVALWVLIVCVIAIVS